MLSVIKRLVCKVGFAAIFLAVLFATAPEKDSQRRRSRSSESVEKVRDQLILASKEAAISTQIVISK